MQTHGYINQLAELINGNAIMVIAYHYRNVVMEILIVPKTCQMSEIVRVSANNVEESI